MPRPNGVGHKPLILGINTVFHETSACLIRGGELLAFAEQERFNRVKKGKVARVDNPHDLPVEAINDCLQRGGVSWNEIDRIAVSFDPSLRHDLLDEATMPDEWGSPDGEATFMQRLMELPLRASELSGIDIENRWSWVPHERAHAASAYFASEFNNAAVMSVDGIGEASTALLAHGVGTELFDLESISYPHSLGFLWEKFSKFLGFGEYDAGKIMALASFGCAGDPVAQEMAARLAKIVTRKNRKFEIANDKLQFRAEHYRGLEELFGKRRQRGEHVGPREAAVALALQEATEEILLDFANRLHEQTGSRHLCLAGGVMMNCVALGRLLGESPFDDIFVQPVAHDAGTAIGAAFAALYAETTCSDRWVMKSPYLGPEFTDKQMLAALQAAGVAFHRSSNVSRETAQAIADGQIIGWFQGAAEAGPRALGNRSILADARHGGSKELINLKAKHREYFRPFAPAVLAEDAPDWFEIPRDSFSLRYMSYALPVRAEKRQAVPAIVHVDGSGRLQVVDRNLNPAFHQLITDFKTISGVPMVVNTSFNTHDEPMVCSPADAVRTFVRTDLDRLIMGNLVAQNPRTARRGNDRKAPTTLRVLAWTDAA